ncbi:MAG: hypothetical protein ABTD50_01020 [Polyangiaceae bacterium]|jgi:hypothetical protein
MSGTFRSLWELETSAFSEVRNSDPAVRTQTAIVRSLVDALEHAAPSSEAATGLRWQLLEELARLSDRIQRAAIAR